MSKMNRLGRKPRAIFFVAAIVLTLSCSSGAYAQIFYEPIQYQYQTPSQTTFYYGGHDPRVFNWADRQDCRHVNVSGYIGQAINPRDPVYTDCRPYTNAAPYGFTVTDARNEANANAPRYFRKADLLAAGVATPEGLVIPAQAQPLAPVRIQPAPTTAPATQGTILIIPKRLLVPSPASNASKMVSAR